MRDRRRRPRSALHADGTFGITAHEIVDSQIDAGPILEQVHVDVPAAASVLYWDYCVNRAGVELLDAVLDDYDAYHAARRDQTGGSYFSYPARADVRAAAARGIRLVTLRDFLHVCRVSREDARPLMRKPWLHARPARHVHSREALRQR